MSNRMAIMILPLVLASRLMGTATGANTLPEGRAAWFNTYSEPFVNLDEQTFRAKIRQAMSQLSGAGLNAIFYLVKTPWDAKAYYNSSIMERITESYDPLKIVIEEGRTAGLEVHAYFNVLAEGDSSPAGMLTRRRDWALVDQGGNPSGWMNPFDEGVRDYVLSIVHELTRYEGLSGIQLDRIRFPGNGVGYNPSILAMFKNATGKTPANDAEPAWVKFRASGVTSLVKAIRDEVRSVAPNLVLSAAVFPDKLSAVATVMQDWETWAKEEYVDFLATMSYTDSVQRLDSYMRDQLQAVNLSMPLYVGINAATLTDSLFMDEITKIRKSPANGFVIFNANALLESAGKLDLLRDNLGGKVPTPHSSIAAWSASRAEARTRWKEYFGASDYSLVLIGGAGLALFGGLALLGLLPKGKKASLRQQHLSQRQCEVCSC